MVTESSIVKHSLRIFAEFLVSMREMGSALLLVSSLGALCLLLAWVLPDIVASQRYVDFIWRPVFVSHNNFYAYINWFLVYLLFYFIIPFSIVLLVFKADFRRFGLGIGELRAYIPAYVLLLLVMLPVVILISRSAGFTGVYPFMRVPVLKFIIIWEFVYCLQFVAVEFFFRGFILFPFCERFGAAGTLFQVLPYCLIHAGKPFPEALSSIVAGFLLGSLAWKSRSIWGGVFLHCCVALSLDLIAIIQRGGIQS